MNIRVADIQAVLAVWIWVEAAQVGTGIVFGILGVIAWLIGSVCRYALSAD
jgi:hypothetical protein